MAVTAQVEQLRKEAETLLAGFSKVRKETEQRYQRAMQEIEFVRSVAEKKGMVAWEVFAALKRMSLHMDIIEMNIRSKDVSLALMRYRNDDNSGIMAWLFVDAITNVGEYAESLRELAEAYQELDDVLGKKVYRAANAICIEVDNFKKHFINLAKRKITNGKRWFWQRKHSFNKLHRLVNDLMDLQPAVEEMATAVKVQILNA